MEKKSGEIFRQTVCASNVSLIFRLCYLPTVYEVWAFSNTAQSIYILTTLVLSVRAGIWNEDLK